MIPGEYIKTFIPIQELDELKPSSGNVAPIKPDDLFLMSQISAYTNKNSSAVAVSKKINYKNFSEKMSSDFDVGKIKLSVANQALSISLLSNALCMVSTDLSNAISLSASTLSIYVNECISSLSTAVGNDFILKYGSQTCSLIDNVNNPDSPAELATSITLSDGQIVDVQKTSLSDLMAPKNWKIACGGIATDRISSESETVSQQKDTIECEILYDCYVNCTISAKEYDSSSPIQVWLSSVLDTDGSSDQTLYCTLNNPGGFSGKSYFSNYHFSIPVKHLFGTKIILRHENSSTKFLPGTVVNWDLYYYYAVPSKDELSGYVSKSGMSLSPYLSEEVCKIKFNSDGLITEATSVYYGNATANNPGLVKVNNPALFTAPNFGLRLNENGFAYTQVARATSSVYGTVKLNNATTSTEINHSHAYGEVSYSSGDKVFLSCGLEANSNGNAQIFIPYATDSHFGVVKTKQGSVEYPAANRNNAMSSFISLDDDGHAYVEVPYAHYDSSGNPLPGIINLGMPDTTDIRVIRNVYLNDAGVACVNVVNQMGIGPFIENQTSGYTKCIDLPLENGVEASTITSKVKRFDGNEDQYSEYGSYAFKVDAEINGWFMAEVMYEGIGQTYTGSSTPYLQIICDGVAVTTIHPSQVQGATGKKFMYSTQLGVFNGGSETGSRRTFAAVSNIANFGHNDKLHFLVKEMSNE